MVMSQPSNTNGVVVDANVLIAVCANEHGKADTAELAMADYASKGRDFYAPNVIIGEVLYVLCQKLHNAELTQFEYEKSVTVFKNQLRGILLSPSGESSLVARAVEIRQGYGCSRSSDSLYIALAEELAVSGNAELLTFDKGFINQVAKNAPTVNVNLLPI